MNIFLALLLTFDWSSIINFQKGVDLSEGSQILHFRSYNKPLDSEALQVVERYFRDAKPCTSDAEVLQLGSESVTLDGLYIELGVCTGKTTNFIAALNPHKKIYGFDSFEGLPEDWVLGERVIPKGSLGFKDPSMLPPVLHNVVLIKGWFEDTLPNFATKPIAFVHIDCDLYSSTATAFKYLGPWIQEGTIIVFDEFYNYPNYEENEFKAFQEFLSESGFKAEYLGYNVNHQQVAAKIKKA